MPGVPADSGFEQRAQEAEESMPSPAEHKASADVADPPRIWLVIGDKPGDNAQVEIIAEALGLPFEIRRVLPKQKYVLGKPFFSPSLRHLDLSRSDALEPPWPDVIFTIGRRPTMAALWIQKQAAGRSRIILLGRPKRWMQRYSLVISPPQYQVPDHPRVFKLGLPLMRSPEATIAEAADAWRERFADLPRPLTTLLVGGPTQPFRFDADTSRELLTAAAEAAGNGFLYVSTSRRTPPEVIATLEKNLPDSARLYRWSADSVDNPYQALLGLSDRFIVTGDSISMMVEIARLGKPLAIFPLPYRSGPGPYLQRLFATYLQQGRPDRAGDRLLIAVGRALHRVGVIGFARDLTATHRILYERGWATPLGQAFPASGPTPADELQRVVERIEALLPG
jgi:mitochondrial fission protein ELM1